MTVFDRCLPWLNFNNYILYLLLKSGGEGFIGMGRSDSSSCPSVTYVRNTWRHSYLNRISSCTKYSKFKWNFHNILGHQTDLSHSGNKLQLVCVRRCAWTVDSFWKNTKQKLMFIRILFLFYGYHGNLAIQWTKTHYIIIKHWKK